MGMANKSAIINGQQQSWNIAEELEHMPNVIGRLLQKHSFPSWGYILQMKLNPTKIKLTRNS